MPLCIAATDAYCPLGSVLATRRYAHRNRYFDPWLVYMACFHDPDK